VSVPEPIAKNNRPAYIGLGSNLGDREGFLRDALARLNERPGIAVVRVSPFCQTVPVGGPPDQSDYLNAAARLDCLLEPEELLHGLRHVEEQLGRTREVRWGPRTIDLDLLLFDELIIDQPDLQVPHPRMHTRYFVMKPLTEIAPDVVHPVLGRTMAEILSSLENSRHA
jgi:2-amino-4-hydroxy-6-hydroxymethyldihydropteridine diphosphokinase